MQKDVLDVIKQALEEDGAFADVTTLSTVAEDQQARASLVTRQAGIVAGLTVAALTFHTFDERLIIEPLVADGAFVERDTVLVRLRGSARSLLSAERVALNFLGHLSGIATQAAHCVRAVEGTHVRLLDTRKTSAEIAYELGYSTPQHFNNAFKKKFGVTPNSVRINP